MTAVCFKLFKQIQGLLPGAVLMLGPLFFIAPPAATAGEFSSTMAPGDDPSRALFPSRRLVRIKIDLDQDDWNSLRAQTRTDDEGVYGQTCLRAPSPRAYSYFPARLSLDGSARLRVGLRKKGFYGSADTVRPSLKVHLAWFERGQTLYGMRKLTLNNAKEDPALVRQCLGYSIYRQAGLLAPRCSFAHLTINGQERGVYVLVESLDKVFVHRHLPPGVCLWEGAMSDFRPGWVRTFERKVGPKKACRDHLAELVTALEQPDSILPDTLAPLIQLDRFLTFWALESLLENADGYSAAANNFFVFGRGVSAQIGFIPWGIDGIMVDPGEADAPFPSSVSTYGILALRLYLLPEWRQAYVQRLERLLESVWDEDSLVAEVERMAQLVRPHLSPGQRDGFGAGLDQLVNFICLRRAVLERELAFGPPLHGIILARPPCPRKYLP